jgi:selenocysteine lyase/cysteine desulfurase
MRHDRREFLMLTGTGLAAVSAGSLVQPNQAAGQASATDTGNSGSWDTVRAAFDLSEDRIHMSAMLIASHPKPVRDAIEEHRRGLDADPVGYLERNDSRLTRAVRSAAAGYLDTDPSLVALTDSTTMGLGLVYNGLRLRPGQEIITTDEDYYVTHESVRLATARSGADMRKIALFQSLDGVTAEEIVDRVAREVRPSTRALAVTWVHSSTGLKIPVARIAERLQEINAGRDEDDRVLLCVDGVHGFGTENSDMPGLGCDFLMAGCHKWLFGPRGTGIVAASERGLSATRPIIPSFIDDSTFTAWINNEAPAGANSGARMTPGGFKAFEHRWALTQAFEFHDGMGKENVTARTHELAGALKEGLAGFTNVSLVTPQSPELSSGIVSFDVDGISPQQAVSALRERGIVASAAPYARPHVRLTPSIRNTEAEIETALSAVHSLVG